MLELKKEKIIIRLPKILPIKCYIILLQKPGAGVDIMAECELIYYNTIIDFL